MKRKQVLIIASCLIGLVAASGYLTRIRHLRDEITSFSEMTPVLTVNRNLHAGDVLTAEDVERTLILEKQVSRRAVLPEDADLIIGRRLLHPIPENDLVLWTDFPEGPRVKRPSENIPHGFRAIALPADESHTLVHFISPGDTVDIVSSHFEGPGERLVSDIIAEDVKVLGVGVLILGSSSDPIDEDYPLSVTLMVEPETARIILRAYQIGEVHFLARGSHPLRGFPETEALSRSPVPSEVNEP